MKKILLVLVVGVILSWTNVFAANGDLMVNGNIGVGTTTPGTNLDVAGGIRAGTVTAQCTAAIAGVMRWNSGSSIYEYCNGTAWTAMGGVGATWRVIWSADVTATTTSITTGNILNGDVDQEYKVIARYVNNTAGDTGLYLQLNGDASAHYQYTQVYGMNSANGGTSGGGSGSYVGFPLGDAGTGTGTESLGEATIYAKSGRVRMANTSVSIYAGGAGAAPWGTILSGCVWNNTASNITSMSFTSAVANGISAGTHIEIWTKR